LFIAWGRTFIYAAGGEALAESSRLSRFIAVRSHWLVFHGRRADYPCERLPTNILAGMMNFSLKTAIELPENVRKYIGAKDLFGR